MGEKGFNVVKALNSIKNKVSLTCIIGKDKGVIDDCSIQLVNFCKDNEIDYCLRNGSGTLTNHCDLSIAAGWRWMIRDIAHEKLIIFHDSLLPKYRGFSPLVNALLNKEGTTGVTALLGADNYDEGNIILQHRIHLHYPTNIESEIKRISEIYGSMAIELVTKLLDGSINLRGTPQDENEISYSLWRDEQDYRINWNNSAEDILHFIACVGKPYLGASTTLNGKFVRINKASTLPEIKIENRTPGKVIFRKGIFPIVVCGSGLLLVEDIRGENNISILPLESLRIRFI